MHTLQIRNLPSDIYEGLKASAKASKRSMTQEAIIAIEHFLGKNGPNVDFETQRKQMVLNNIKQLHKTTPLKTIPDAWFEEDLK